LATATRSTVGKTQDFAGCGDSLPVLTLGALASKRTSPDGPKVSSELAGQNRNDAGVDSVLRLSPVKSRSPGLASNGVSVLRRMSLPPPADRTNPTGCSP